MAGAETIGAAQLLEREQELATLAVLRATATAGGAGVGLIEGAAGIGKSQLLVEARRQATIAGLRVLWARAVNWSASSRSASSVSSSNPCWPAMTAR